MDRIVQDGNDRRGAPQLPLGVAREGAAALRLCLDRQGKPLLPPPSNREVCSVILPSFHS